MRVHRFVVAAVTACAVAAIAAGVLVSSGSANPAFNNPVRITNTSCHLNYTSVSRQYSRVVFGVANNGTVAHGFDLSTNYKTGLIKPGQEATIVANLRPGAYRYACVSAHSTVKKGVFTIR
jgi:hypothetical protein